MMGVMILDTNLQDLEISGDGRHIPMSSLLSRSKPIPTRGDLGGLQSRFNGAVKDETWRELETLCTSVRYVR